MSVQTLETDWLKTATGLARVHAAEVIGLDACPFCGSREVHLTRPVVSGAAVVAVQCGECDCRGPLARGEVDGETKEQEAVRLWNARKAAS